MDAVILEGKIGIILYLYDLAHIPLFIICYIVQHTAVKHTYHMHTILVHAHTYTTREYLHQISNMYHIHARLLTDLRPAPTKPLTNRMRLFRDIGH